MLLVICMQHTFFAYFVAELKYSILCKKAILEFGYFQKCLKYWLP